MNLEDLKDLCTRETLMCAGVLAAVYLIYSFYLNIVLKD